MLSVYFTKARIIGIILILSSTLFACAGKTGGNNVINNESLVISAPSESTITINGSTNLTISIPNITVDTSITITNNNSSVIAVTPSQCTLSVTTNSCVATITGVSAGTGSLTVNATGLESATSEIITVLPTIATGFVFGSINGLIFKNNTLMPGNSALSTVDGSYVFGLVIDTDNNLYAGTFGATYGGFGAGKVFKYDNNTGYWTILLGDVDGGSLDGSSVNVLALDSNNNLYAGTNAGNVFKYINGVWTIMGYLLNNPITTITIDNDNNIYAGTDGDGNVFKYVNGTWQALGSPDTTKVTSLATNPNDDLYAATAGNSDGQVYMYDAGNNSWNSLSSFSDGAVNSITTYNNILYAGTNAGNLYEYNGNSWNQLGTTPDTSAITTLMVNANDIYIGSAGTSDNGQTYSYNNGGWNQLGTLNNGEITNILIQNNQIYTSTANNGNSLGAVYQYTNNGWSSLGTGSLDGTPIYSMSQDSDGNYYAGTLLNIYKSSLTGNTWSLLGNINQIDGSGVATQAIYDNTIYVGTFAGNILRSSTTSGNWALIGTPQADSTISALKINPMGVLYTSSNNTNDNLGTVSRYESNMWTLLSGTGTNGSIDNSTIQSIALDNTNNIYAATAGTGSGGFVWKYTAGGNSWAIVGLGTLDGSAVSSITIDSNNTLYAGTNNGNIFKYNGITWDLITTPPLDGSGISNIVFDSSGNLYATTYGGSIWQYLPNTSLWINTNYGLGVSINLGGVIGL